MLRRWMLMTAVAAGFGLAGYQEVHADWTVYICNAAEHNYQWPQWSDWFKRSGLARSTFTTADSCIRDISDRIADGKRTGTDYECYIVVRTDRYPLEPANRWGTLSDVVGGSYGSWSGWYIYYTPARNRGFVVTPYWNFRPYGPASRAAAKAPNGATSSPFGITPPLLRAKSTTPRGGPSSLPAIKPPPTPAKAAPTNSRNTLGAYRSPTFERRRLSALMALKEWHPRSDQLAISYLDSRAVCRRGELRPSIPCVSSLRVSNRC